MDKRQIQKQLVEKAQEELAKAKQTHATTVTMSRDGDIKQEGKYDTRAIEAGYLAGAQGARVEELAQELQMLEEMDTNHSDQVASIGSLALLEHNNLQKWYFISPTSGGSLVQHQGETVLVISAFSPIGAELINLNAGDEFEIETPKENRIYRVLKIC